MKHSERLEAIRHRLDDYHIQILTDEENRDLRKAVKVIERVESGQGFSATAVVNPQDGKARVDVCWMGMLANVNLDLAKSIARELEAVAIKAEHESILARFLHREVDMSGGDASELLKKFRDFRDRPADNQSKIVNPFST